MNSDDIARRAYGLAQSKAVDSELWTLQNMPDDELIRQFVEAWEEERGERLRAWNRDIGAFVVPNEVWVKELRQRLIETRKKALGVR